MIFSKNIVLALGWALLISILTIIKVSPEYLDADVLMNSVMSLQRLTLYYWGQNSLLNVLPFATSAIKDPSTNLLAVMVLTSFSFYGLLYLISRAAALILKVGNVDKVSLNTFLVISCGFTFIFKPKALYDIAVAHKEYSLPALILVFSFITLNSKKDGIKSKFLLVFSILLIILAIGINPSTIIPGFFILFANFFYRRQVRLNEFAFIQMI